MDSFTDKDYRFLCEYIHDKLGIDMDDKKRETVASKINRLVVRHGMSSYKEYVDMLCRSQNNHEIQQEFFDEITTNTTEFFREAAHFDYISDNIDLILRENPRIRRNGEIRVWSAPCSSGEESVSLAITLNECLPTGVKIKILATDISEKMLRKALNGVYTENECRDMPREYAKKYMSLLKNGNYSVSPYIKSCISYRHFNLMDDFNFNYGFDIVFCRNLMIYQNSAVQQNLIDKFYENIVAGGLFFIGHSESMLNKKHSFSFVSNAIYQK